MTLVRGLTRKRAVMSDEETCVYCKGRTEAHCDNGGCAWQRCSECSTILWPDAARAMRRGQPVPWPYSRPDAA
jgi:hypothetical protein